MRLLSLCLTCVFLFSAYKQNRPAPEVIEDPVDYYSQDDMEKDFGDDTLTDEQADGDLSIWSYTDEFSIIVDEYINAHPDSNINPDYTIYGTDRYQEQLEIALTGVWDDCPDIFVIESSYAYDYIKGEFSEYCLPYKDLGIDVDAKAKDAQISQYLLESGSNINGDIVAMSYQSDAGLIFYRRSIAKEVWGFDDEQSVRNKIGGLSGGWDDFMNASKELHDKGYCMFSSMDDMWNIVEDSGYEPWVDAFGNKCINTEREEYLDLAKEMINNNYVHPDEYSWTGEWFDGMRKDSDVFAYAGPEWFLDYVLIPNAEETSGDWGACLPPYGFYWGGSYIFVNKDLDDSKKAAVRDLLEWATLDCTENGLQYKICNGEIEYFSEGACVPSEKVMLNSVRNKEFLNGQEVNSMFAIASNIAYADSFGLNDEYFAAMWKDYANRYAKGEIDKETVISEMLSCLEGY